VRHYKRKRRKENHSWPQGEKEKELVNVPATTLLLTYPDVRKRKQKKNQKKKKEIRPHSRQ